MFLMNPSAIQQIEVYYLRSGEPHARVFWCSTRNSCANAVATILREPNIVSFGLVVRGRGYPQGPVVTYVRPYPGGNFTVLDGSTQVANRALNEMPEAERPVPGGPRPPRSAPSRPASRARATPAQPTRPVPRPPARATRRTRVPPVQVPVTVRKTYFVRVEKPSGVRTRGARTYEQARAILAEEVAAAVYDFGTTRTFTLVEEDAATGTQRVIQRMVG